MTQNQAKKKLEKLGFEVLRATPEAGDIVVQEWNKVLEKNGISTELNYPWEAPGYYDTQSTLDECQRVFGGKEVFTMHLGHTFLVKISEEALEKLLEQKHLFIELYVYRPGNALLYISTESTWYDNRNAIPAKVLYAQLRTKLHEYLTIPDAWKEAGYGGNS